MKFFRRHRARVREYRIARTPRIYEGEYSRQWTVDSIPRIGKRKNWILAAGLSVHQNN